MVLIILLVTVAVLIILLILLLLSAFISINSIEVYSRIFNNVAIGFGAILAGLGGLRYLVNYIEEKEKINGIKNEIKKYQKVYPPLQKNITYKIVQSSDKKGKIYILDKDNILHHVRNYPTFLDLDLSQDEIETIKAEDFSKYSVGKSIQTRSE